MQTSSDRNLVNVDVGIFLKIKDCGGEASYLWVNNLLTYVHNYLLIPWSRVLLEKVTGSAASQEIPRIFGTRRFITVLTSACHLSLS